MLVDAVINQSSQTSETISLNHCFNQWSKCVGQGISNNLSNPIAQQKHPPKKKMANLSQPLFKKTWSGNDPFSHNHGFSVKKWVNSPIVLTFQSQLELWRFLVRNPNLNVHLPTKKPSPFLAKFTVTLRPHEILFFQSQRLYLHRSCRCLKLETGERSQLVTFSCRKFLLMATLK